MDTVTGTVLSTEQVGNTAWATPILNVSMLTSSGGNGNNYQTFRVMHDASLNYEIRNPEFRDEPHTFELTRAGRLKRVLGVSDV